MAELKPFEVIMRIDFAASKGPEVVAHSETVQELVRCKDCKWFDEYTENGVSEGIGFCTNPVFDVYNRLKTDWFCADGERREDG